MIPNILAVFTHLPILAQAGEDLPAAPSTAGTIVTGLIGLAFLVLIIAAIWKVFTKAGEPGWAAIIPIYNIIVLLKIAGKPWWWLFLMFIPIVNFVIALLVALAVAKAFNKGAGFGVGILFLPFIFYPILAFSDAQYVRPDKVN